MMAYIQYYPETNSLGVVGTDWCGKPRTHGQVIYCAWPTVGGVISERWYKYTFEHVARGVQYDQLPEAVRLAYMLMQ